MPFPFTRNLPSCGLSGGTCSFNWEFDDLMTMHKILLAEDDNDMRRFLVKALENAGFQVSSHDNGLSAYQRLREEPFEMLLTDIVMPEMDGIELARRASELDPDIKIMFITGFAAVALNSDSEAPKNAKVLSKPVHLRELVSEVNKMLAACSGARFRGNRAQNRSGTGGNCPCLSGPEPIYGPPTHPILLGHVAQ